jgi:ubiquinone biosynthesis protein COQ4
MRPIRVAKGAPCAIASNTAQNSGSNAREVAWPERLIERFFSVAAMGKKVLQKSDGCVIFVEPETGASSMTDAALPNAAFGGPAADERIKPMKLQPLRALKAFRKLIADKDDTVQVFEIMQAMNGRSTAKGYRRLMSTARGGKIAYDRLEIAKLLSDDALVDKFAPGTVGAAYRHFVRSEGLSAEGLAEESRKARGSAPEVEHPIAWFGRRIRDTHDVWHILSGYHRDGLGELCLVAFSYAQTRSFGWAFIAIGGVLQGFRDGQGVLTAKAVWQGYRNGKQAAWLPGEDFEALLNEPLDAARARLNIAKPTYYDAMPEVLRNRTMAAPALCGAVPA